MMKTCAWKHICFHEVTTDNEISFDYKLRDGVTTGSNAIRLPARCKYDPTIVAEAEAAAEWFRASGEWSTNAK